MTGSVRCSVERSWRAAAALLVCIGALTAASSPLVKAGDTDDRYGLLRFNPSSAGEPILSSLPEAPDDVLPGGLVPDTVDGRPPHRKAAPPARSATGQGERLTYCVRTCDGFFFPIGPVASSGDLPAHRETCRALCPAAETKLFVGPTGDITHAVAGDGTPYVALSQAFAYRVTRGEGCTCSQTKASHYSRIMSDRTLRPGDAVMVGTRLLVFKGAKHWPLQPSDFAYLPKARISPVQREELSIVAGASPRRMTARGGERQAMVKPPRRSPVRQSQPVHDAMAPLGSGQNPPAE